MTEESTPPTDATDGTADATDGTADATDGTADATDGTADATDGPADATDGPADATDGPADATDGALVAPADSAAEDADSDTAARWAVTRVERYAIGLGAAATGLVLVAVFYYPVATVFREAFFPDGLLTGAVFVSILTDPFYMGELGRLLSGEPPGEVLRRVASPERQLGILGFTAYQAALSTVASVALGVPAAWILARFEFRGRETLRSLTILPFVLPSIMVAVGFVATFGRDGTLNAILGSVGLGPVELMFTLEAIVIAHAFYNAPLVARVVTAAWEAVDARAVETARSLGASPHRAFLDVVAPQLYPAVLMGATLTFVFTFASFPIVLALGGFQLATVEVFVYRLIRDLNYADAAGLAIIELVISLSLTYAYLRYEAANAVRRGAAAPGRRKRLLPRTWTPTALIERFAVAGYALLAVAVFVLPLASMIWASLTGPAGFTLDHYRFLLERQATGAAFQVQPWPAVRNSLVFAVATLFVAVPMGLVVAVATTRRYRGRKVVDALAMAPFAVSGIIVGLGLLRGLVFGVEIGGWRLTVAGAVAIVAAHAVSAYPFVTRNVAPGLEGLDPALTESARALGASRVRALVDVELPLVWPGVVAGAAFAVAISIGEFNSTIVLATGTDSYTMPVAVERYLGRRLGPATAMGVLLLAVTSASFIVVERLGGYVRH